MVLSLLLTPAVCTAVAGACTSPCNQDPSSSAAHSTSRQGASSSTENTRGTGAGGIAGRNGTVVGRVMSLIGSNPGSSTDCRQWRRRQQNGSLCYGGSRRVGVTAAAPAAQQQQWCYLQDRWGSRGIVVWVLYSRQCWWCWGDIQGCVRLFILDHTIVGALPFDGASSSNSGSSRQPQKGVLRKQVCGALPEGGSSVVFQQKSSVQFTSRPALQRHVPLL